MPSMASNKLNAKTYVVSQGVIILSIVFCCYICVPFDIVNM